MGRRKKNRQDASTKKKMELGLRTNFVNSECSLLHDSKSSAPPNVTIDELENSEIDLSIRSSFRSVGTSENVAPFSKVELETLLARIDGLHMSDHDKALLRVLESIIAEVEFGNANFYDMYVYFIHRLCISSAKTSTSALVALMRCLARGDSTKLVDSLIMSICRSLRRALIDPLAKEDLELLISSVLEESSLHLLQELITANEFAIFRRTCTMPPDREKVSLALKAAGCAFTSIEDLLDNVNRIDAENSSCVKQVKLILHSVFTKNREFLETHARPLVETSQRIGYCPPEALSVIVPLLHEAMKNGLATDNSKSCYGMALLFLANVDLQKVKSKELLEAISLLGQIYKLAPSALRDILPCFASVYKNCLLCCASQRDIIVQALLNEALHIAEETNDYERQLDLVGFFEDLQKQGVRVPTEACGVLVAKATGVSLINRVCGILLWLEETNDNIVDDEMIAKVKERTQVWYPIAKDKAQRIRTLEVIRIEQPSLYRYIKTRKRQGPAEGLQEIL
ncbi:uncharacterized protein LOC111246517 isoform X2 [Varroa destructor]|nr:uncharacterized protein LOC111246517 isoform X2 [Varroa destructor]XP_022651987.1 uncharacterized protein LOC111246517 isoform X2 [Varroa destructor]